MKCPNCSKEIANDSNFCEYCGKKITKLHTDLPYGDGDDNGNIRKLICALSLCAGAIVVIVIILFTRANSCQPSVIEPIPGYPMVWIEGGKFIRGDISAPPDEDNYTTNSDSIEISGFYMGQYEVSQEIWEQVMGTNPSYHSDNTQNPVENVTFNDVITFINKANTQYKSQLGNRRFSLPTEAEWEYAAGDGHLSKKKLIYAGLILDGNSWYEENSHGETHPVGLLQPNRLGLYDMTGNVCEWCLDYYSESYSLTSKKNPCNKIDEGFGRVIRGGCYSDGKESEALKITTRDFLQERETSESVGFRLVLK